MLALALTALAVHSAALAHVDLTALTHILLSALAHVDLTALTLCLAVLTVHSTGFTVCHFSYLIPYIEIFIRSARLFFSATHQQF